MVACSGSSDKAGGRSDDGAVVLTLADQSQGPVDIQAWIDEVERLSGGSIRIDVKSRWRSRSPNAEQRTIADVRTGRIDLAKIGAGAWATVGVTSFDPLVAPLLIDSYELERSVLTSGIARRALAGTAKVGLVGLAVIPGPLERPIGIAHRVLARREYGGATIGVRAGRPIQDATVEALGGRGAAFVPGDTIRALDGFVLHLESIQFHRYDDVAAVTANVNLWPDVTTIVMNRAAFDALTANQQESLLNAGGVAVPEALEFVQQLDREAAGTLCRRGVSFARATRQDLARLRAAVQPVYDEIARARDARSVLREITALKRGLGFAPSLPARCARAPDDVANPVKTRLDGVYRASFTREDLAESALLYDAGELNDENWGDYTLTLDHGRVALIQRNDLASYSTSGTFTVKDDVLSVRFTSGGIAGESFVFRWSLYRGALKLDRDETLGIAPTSFLIEPWRRVR